MSNRKPTAVRPKRTAASRRRSVAATPSTLVSTDEQLRLAVEAAGIGIFSIDLDAGEVSYSPELAGMLGFPDVRRARLVDAFTRVHRDDVDRVGAEFRAAQDPAGDGRLLMEFRFVRPGGEVRWMTWNGRIEFRQAKGGRVAHRIIGACVDVTGRKEAEQRRVESEARFRDLVELSSDWYWEQDAELRFVEISDPVQALAGSSPRSHIGKRRWELPAIGVTEAEWAAHRATLARREPFRNFEYRRVNEQGDVIWMSVNGVPVYDAAGRFRGYRGTGHNITARREQEALLRESEARFRLLADSAPVLIWVAGPDGGEFFNRPFVSFVGASSEADLVGDGWLGWLHQDDRQVFLAACDACAREGRQFEAQVRLRRCDGRYRWMKAIGLPRPGSGVRVAGYVASALDITDVKDSEERIIHLVRELDHRVKNILARFEVVIDRTAEGAGSRQAFVAALRERVASMASAHRLLSLSRWQGASLRRTIEVQLEAYATAHNLVVDGPALELNADATQAISIVVNELATNAAKYGALSRPEGRVSVTWRLDRDAASRECVLIDWVELGGPKVVRPRRESYGAAAIRDLVAHELDGEVELTFAAKGVTCRIRVPTSEARRNG